MSLTPVVCRQCGFHEQPCRLQEAVGEHLHWRRGYDDTAWDRPLISEAARSHRFLPGIPGQAVSGEGGVLLLSTIQRFGDGRLRLVGPEESEALHASYSATHVPGELLGRSSSSRSG